MDKNPSAIVSQVSYDTYKKQALWLRWKVSEKEALNKYESFIGLIVIVIDLPEEGEFSFCVTEDFKRAIVLPTEWLEFIVK